MKYFVRISDQYWTGAIRCKPHTDKIEFSLTPYKENAREFSDEDSVIQEIKYWEGRGIATCNVWIDSEAEITKWINGCSGKIPDGVFPSCSDNIIGIDYSRNARQSCSVCGGAGYQYEGTFERNHLNIEKVPCNYCATMREYEKIRGTIFNQIRENYFPSGKPKMRTITEICKDADRHKNSKYELNQLKYELNDFKEEHGEINYRFATEHINNYLRSIKERETRNKIRDKFRDDD